MTKAPGLVVGDTGLEMRERGGCMDAEAGTGLTCHEKTASAFRDHAHEVLHGLAGTLKSSDAKLQGLSAVFCLPLCVRWCLQICCSSCDGFPSC